MDKHMKLLTLSVVVIFLLLPSASYASHLGSQSFQKPDFSDNETTQADIEMENALLGKPKLLPDSPFYFLKQIKEKIQLALAFNKQKKSDLLVELAKERLAEAKSLTEKGKTREAEKAIGSYNSELKRLNSAETEAQRMHLDSAAESILESATERAPEEAREGLRIALNRSGNRTYFREREDEPEEETENETEWQNATFPASGNETEDEKDSEDSYSQKNETQTGRNQTQESEKEAEQPKHDYKTNTTEPTNISRNSTEDHGNEDDRHEERNSTTSRRSYDEKD